MDLSSLRVLEAEQWTTWTPVSGFLLKQSVLKVHPSGGGCQGLLLSESEYRPFRREDRWATCCLPTVRQWARAPVQSALWMCVDKHLSINLCFLGCVVGAGLLDECNWAPFTCYLSSSLHRMPSCVKGSFFTVFSAFSEGLGKNAKVQLKLSHHQRPTHSGNESCGGDGGCEKFLGHVSVWAQPPAAESQEDHPQVPRLVSGEAAVSDRGRQDSLDPGKLGLESNIHSSTQSPLGDSPQNGGPWPVRPPAFGASAKRLGALALGGHHITSLDPQRLSFQQEGNQSGCRELVVLSLNQDACSFDGLLAIHSTPGHGAARAVQW